MEGGLGRVIQKIVFWKTERVKFGFFTQIVIGFIPTRTEIKRGVGPGKFFYFTPRGNIPYGLGGPHFFTLKSWSKFPLL